MVSADRSSEHVKIDARIVSMHCDARAGVIDLSLRSDPPNAALLRQQLEMRGFEVKELTSMTGMNDIGFFGLRLRKLAANISERELYDILKEIRGIQMNCPEPK